MTTYLTQRTLQQLWLSAVLFGLVAAATGVVILVWPGPSIVVAAVLFGIYLVISGAWMIVMAFAWPTSAGIRVLNFIAGAVSIILGVLAFRHFGEGYALFLLAIWIAVGFIFRGISALAAASEGPQFPGRGWTIFFGILAIIAGIVVLAFPFDSIVTLALVVGIWLIVLGAMEVFAGFAMRSDAKKLEKTIEAATTSGENYSRP